MRNSILGNTAISLLFVPGSRPDRFIKALTSGADEVIIDLEDAVAPEDKSRAREITRASLINGGLDRSVFIRINPPGTPWYIDDVAAMQSIATSSEGALAGIMLPKCESAEQIEELATTFGSETRIIALIETAAGIAQINDIAKAQGLSRLALGAVDFSADVSADLDSVTITAAYAALVIHSRAAGLPSPVASPPLSFTDIDGITTQARVLRGMGLGGQLCIHPHQIEPIHDGFAPTTQELEWARRVMSTTGAATQIDGAMVDKPVRDRAERFLRAERTGHK
ncbi:MAG: HpcH/HpaI aldolase/citrate lyase family protein [Microbacteriaceae bacterium]